jgi:flavin reductase (DIM6/NTAB) family NADH-FMN oxidoreductase RutF
LAGAAFGVNVLAGDQRDLALHFAGRERMPPERVPWLDDADRLRLGGCTAYLFCTPWAAYDGGDHVLYVGQVHHFDIYGGEPLVFHRSMFRELVRTPVPPTWIGSLDGPDGWRMSAAAAT